MRFILSFGLMVFSFSATAQEVSLYQKSVQFNNEIRRASNEQSRLHLELNAIFDSLEMRQSEEVAFQPMFEIVNRGPASIFDEPEADFINEFRIIMLPKFHPYTPAHN